MDLEKKLHTRVRPNGIKNISNQKKKIKLKIIKLK